MDLVDEQHVAIFQIGEKRRQIARLGDDRTRGGPEADPQLARDDLRQRRLAEPWGPEEQHMVERVPAGLGRRDEDAQIFPCRALADEIVERLGPERGIDVLRPFVARDDAFLLHARQL